MANNVAFSFTTGAADTVLPTVISTNPADGATAVPANSTITVTFSEVIDPTSIVFTLQNGTNSVLGSVTYNDGLTMMTFTPAAALTSNTQYSVSVSGTDLAGYGPATQTWSFTTGP
jgi:methionine-rich copper-binding protein CopC